MGAVRDLPVSDEEMPSAARALARAAREAGFEVVARYARGPWWDRGGREVGTRQSIGVGGKHPDGRYFRALWLSQDWPKPQRFAFHSGDTDQAAMVSARGLRDHLRTLPVD